MKKTVYEHISFFQLLLVPFFGATCFFLARNVSVDAAFGVFMLGWLLIYLACTLWADCYRWAAPQAYWTQVISSIVGLSAIFSADVSLYGLLVVVGSMLIVVFGLKVPPYQDASVEPK